MSSAAAPNSIATAASAIIVAGVRPHDVDPQDAIRLGVSQDLHKAFGLQVDLGAPIGQ